MNYEDYFKEFMQDIYTRSEAESDFSEVIFTERISDFLVDQAVLENYTAISFKRKTLGIKVDGYDLSEEGDVLTLIVTEFNVEPKSLTRSDITRTIKRIVKYFKKCLEESFYQSLDESDPGFSLSREICLAAPNLRKIRFVLLSNGSLSSRVDAIQEEEQVQGIPCTYDIWDLSRIQRFEESGKSREDIVVDFTEILSEGLPCLPAYTGKNIYKSYLLAMPGALVADLYDRYGERLLEQNVRTFLQFRGKVNKGLRNTIRNEPEMFFAYNNGITATAEDVTTDDVSGMVRISTIKNFQIVNGGQTTASLFNTRRQNSADLSNVHVQVKLTVIPPEETEEVVPRISEYANTQNKVSAADFFSNHPFHLRIEEISRRLFAPSSEGQLRETKWYYERVRGQYANALSSMTPAEQKKFKLKYPKKQMFVKTDLAKYVNSWGMQPQLVSKGAQKNFVTFAEAVSKAWPENHNEYNDLFFKRLVAKAILFKTVDSFIMKQWWYGGYKANIVTYTIAKYASMIKESGMFLDLLHIWEQQAVSEEMQSFLLDIAESVNDVIKATPSEVTNVTEYCKKELCWQKVQEISLVIPPVVKEELISRQKRSQRDTDAKAVRKIDNGIEAQQYVLEKGAGYWGQMLSWSRNKRVFIPRQTRLLEIASQIPSRLPSEIDSTNLLEIEQKALEEGFHI